VTRSQLDIYMLAIGGTGMAPLACLLQDQGHCVRGVDGPLYPPMSTLLAAAGIEPQVGYDPGHLEPPPDLVVIGNAVHRSNLEALEAERRGLPIVSMPQALARFFLAGKRPLVVAGTHGKTTTTALGAFVYTQCGQDPGYLIGGVPRDLPSSFHAGGGERFIVEGDEYNAAYFDRGPKFLHYQPETLILTSVEYDHADLYATPEALWEAYSRLIALLPPAGLLVACGDSEKVRELAAGAPCRTVFYGLSAENEVHPEGPIEALPEGSRLVIAEDGSRTRIELALAGGHNVSNALAVWAAARHHGLSATAVSSALSRFRGVRRRLEELGEGGGVVVVDDFAHHPTAVAKTIEALRQRYPGRRLVVLFEPRSLTAGRNFFFEPYCAAFAGADQVLFAPIFHSGRLADEERLDLPALAGRLHAVGVAAEVCASDGALFETAMAAAQPGVVLATMSSGSFNGLPQRLAEALVASGLGL
jgi:UDP-N-acetylmuramate: L-alanyl-gamma-D-glutamyl-meso-diaminopimelate ligase